MAVGTAREQGVASTPTDLRIHVVLDFDGTITVRDTGDDLFRTFGEFEPIHSQLLAGEMSVREYYKASAQRLRAGLQPAEINDFALSREVDPGFAALVDLCRDNGAHVIVASDGFDAYISPLLESVGYGAGTKEFADLPNS